MGKTFSSNKDFNRVLATQPRSSIHMPKYDPPNNLEELSRVNSFTIPAPLRSSQAKRRKKSRPATISNQSSVVNEHIQSTQPLVQSNPSTVVHNQIQQKFEGEKPQEQIITRNPSFSVQSNSSTHQQAMNCNAAVISRSVINPNNHQERRNFRSSSIRPSHTIIERNGKKFFTEFKERTERRYVQCFDESTQQMRYFEVIDRIPYRIIRPYREKYQFLSQNNIFQNNSRPPIQSNQQPASSQIFNGWSNHSSNRTPQNLHHAPSKVLFPPQSTLFSQSTRQNAAQPFDHYSQYSQPNPPQSLSIGPKNVSNGYSSKLSSFRTHTPTISDGRASYSTVESSDSEEETEGDDQATVAQRLRTNENIGDYDLIKSSPSNSYKINNGYKSPTPVDPFARSLNTNGHHHYRKRSIIQNYAEPMVKNRGFQKSTYPDYAPIPSTIK